MNPSAIPAELREVPRWVVWRWEPDPDKPGKPRKPPYQAADPTRLASSTNPETWSTFSEAVAVVEAGRADGIGFALMPPWVGVDLDAELSQIERDAILLALCTYSERSPSGSGYHAVLRASLNGRGKHPVGFGVFQTDRFFYFTGDVELDLGLPATIEDRQRELDMVLDQYLPQPKPSTNGAKPAVPVDLDDHELLERMFASESGAKIRRLWSGDWTGYPSQSEADQALCNYLAWWTDRDADRIASLFTSSGLYRAEKWSRDTYREPTIQRAIAATAEGYRSSARNVEMLVMPDSGASLLNDVNRLLRRFIVITAAQADACTLWVAHTHAIGAAETTPYLAVTSALKRSGKSRMREVLELLVHAPLSASNISDAALFRAIANLTPTLLLDEADAIFKAREREDLRGLLNAGYRRGAVAYRMGGANRTTLEAFPVFSAKAFFGIGDFLPDTLANRAIPIRLERRMREEEVERFRARDVEAEGFTLRDQLAGWLEPQLDYLRAARPVLPDELDDRAQDSWEPLFAIADLAGGDWPDRARAAAVNLMTGEEHEDDSNTARLLRDVHDVFARNGDGTLRTTDLLGGLHAIEESPWADYYGKPLSAHGLSRLLKPYRIKTMSAWHDGVTVRGFKAEQFADAWARVLGVRSVRSVRDESPSHAAPNTPNAPNADTPTTLEGDQTTVWQIRANQEEPA